MDGLASLIDDPDVDSPSGIREGESGEEQVDSV
jgi:hypothetical protein